MAVLFAVTESNVADCTVAVVETEEALGEVAIDTTIDDEVPGSTLSGVHPADGPAWQFQPGPWTAIIEVPSDVSNATLADDAVLGPAFEMLKVCCTTEPPAGEAEAETA